MLRDAEGFVMHCGVIKRQIEIVYILLEIKSGCSADLEISNQSLGKLLLLLCHEVHGTRSKNSPLRAGSVILQEAALYAIHIPAAE